MSTFVSEECLVSNLIAVDSMLHLALYVDKP
jgi:hypothetical protein